MSENENGDEKCAAPPATWLVTNKIGPMAEETRAYLAEAETRIGALPDVDAAREKVERVVLPRVNDGRLLPNRNHGRFAPGTVDAETEALIAPLSPPDQAKARRLKRRYAPGAVETMHRHPDHATSVEAAHFVAKRGMTELEEIIHACFVQHGEMNDEQLEELPEIARLNLGKTTARKRRTDLCNKGKLVIVGTRRNARGRPMNVYDIPNREAWGERASDA